MLIRKCVISTTNDSFVIPYYEEIQMKANKGSQEDLRV